MNIKLYSIYSFEYLQMVEKQLVRSYIHGNIFVIYFHHPRDKDHVNSWQGKGHGSTLDIAVNDDVTF